MAKTNESERDINSELKTIFKSTYEEEMNPLVVALSATRSSLGVWDVDLVNNKTVWSTRMKKMIGAPDDMQITMKSFFSIVHPDDQNLFETAVQSALTEGKVIDIQHRIISPSDGRIIWVENSGQAVFNEVNKAIRCMGTVIDITALKDAEARAVSSDRSKSEFLANMSHEIRTPMNGVMGMAELLQNTELNPRQTDFVNVINRSGKALLTIINDILDFSKIEAGQLELDETPFLLRDSIEDVTALLSTKVAETGVDLLLRIQPDLPRTYFGDVGRIRQVLTNIVGNAVKFTPVGHVLIDVGGEVKDGIGNLVFKISDTGIGISEDKLSHIFDKFNQADGSTTRKYGGTGLGLTISRDLVELMGGDISVESTIGEGSTFTVSMRLPVHEDIIAPTLDHLNISGSKILVIDDNPVNRDILKEQLTYWECQCAPASSSEVGLRILDKAKEKKIKLDLIIVDYQMPDSNGESFVRSLQAHPDHADIPVIMLSSVDRSDLRQRMKALNIADFLTKPARASTLHNAIGEVLCRNVVDKIHPHSATHTPRMESKALMTSGHVDVLIAEDNDVNQMYAKYVMEDMGLSFKIAPNGRIAVDKWKVLSPKVILMDISMPEMNGYEATAAIRKLEAKNNLPRTPILAVTAHALKPDKDVCLANDMDDYLAKPLSIANLREKLVLWGVIEDTAKLEGSA